MLEEFLFEGFPCRTLRDALDLAARHFNTKQIARDLDISPRTVQAHLDAARQRLGVATRAEAVQLLLDTPSATTCSATPIVDPAPELAETFLAEGFVQLRGRPRFYVYEPGAEPAAGSSVWFIMAGDSDGEFLQAASDFYNPQTVPGVSALERAPC